MNTLYTAPNGLADVVLGLNIRSERAILVRGRRAGVWFIDTDGLAYDVASAEAFHAAVDHAAHLSRKLGALEHVSEVGRGVRA